MLVSLHIENIAVIKCVDVDFERGFTALTGETGAGKSILIDSINFLLGARSSRELLRSGEEKATVSAMFCNLDSEAERILESNELFPDEDGNLLISRTMTQDGRTQCKINGRTVSSSTVRDIAPVLVNIHGQNDSLRLLDDENHIAFLDAYARNSAILLEYSEKYSAYKNAKAALAEIEQKKKEKANKEAELKKIIKVLESVKIKPGEEDKLLEEKRIAANHEKISKQTSFVWRALKGSDKANAAYILDRCAAALLQIADSLPQAEQLAERLKSLQLEAEDIAESVYDFAGDIGEDPTEKLDRIESRIASIQKLKKMFLTDESGLVDLLEKSKKELAALESLEDAIIDLQKRFTAAEALAIKAAEKLRKSREDASKLLIPRVLSELEFLDMEKVVFDIRISDLDKLTENGSDEVVFMISANRGEEPRPISKIASGGELARIMLAIKTVFADAFGIHTVIYDEVDTGVSGKTARKIGIKLKQSSRSAQTVCVTHSAQIASLADTHMLISKDVVGERTETSVKIIDGEERTAEIARILSGVTVSENMMVSARELIDEGKNYKI